MGREFKLMPKPAERAARIKAMTDDQLRAFLATLHDPTHPHERRHYPLFFLLSRTGLRIGEAFALTPDDIDFVRGVVRVERAFSDGILGTPKTAESTRDVDLSPALADVLRRHLRDRATRCLAHGFTAPWLFLSETGSRLTKQNTSRAMSRLCRRAGIGHFTPHDLRHTFASLLLANGESPRYVQQQLGHKTLSMTTDLYGKWLRAKPLRGGTAALDAPTPGLQTGLHATLADHIRQ
jgi:integrase